MAARIKFSRPADPTGAPVLGWRVRRKRGTGLEAQIVELPIGSIGTTVTDHGATAVPRYSWRDSAAVNGDVYRAVAYNVNGESTPSSPVSYVEPVQAVPGTPSLTLAGTTKTLTWTAPSAGSSPITDYELQRKRGTAAFARVNAVGTGLSYVDSGMLDDDQYQVRAINAVGAGAFSNIVTADLVVNTTRLLYRPRTTFTREVDLNLVETRTFSGTSSEHLRVIGRKSALDTRRGLFFQGYGSVTLIGGYYRPSSRAAWPSGKASPAAFYFDEVTSMYVEGTHLDCVNVPEADACQVVARARKTAIVLQNNRWMNVTGTQAGGHGDVFQTGSTTQGPAGSLRVDRMTGASTFQGWYIAPQAPEGPGFGAGGLRAHHVNLIHNGSLETMNFFFWHGDTFARRYSVYLEHCYGQDNPGRETMPTTGTSGIPTNARAVSATDPVTGRSAWGYPGMRTDSLGPMTGPSGTAYVVRGAPAKGDWVPAIDPRTGKAWGLDYVSPGYV